MVVVLSTRFHGNLWLIYRNKYFYSLVPRVKIIKHDDYARMIMQVQKLIWSEVQHFIFIFFMLTSIHSSLDALQLGHAALVLWEKKALHVIDTLNLTVYKQRWLHTARTWWHVHTPAQIYRQLPLDELTVAGCKIFTYRPTLRSKRTKNSKS